MAKGIDFYASRRDQQEPFNEQKPIVKSKTPQESVSISQGGCNDNSMPTIVNWPSDASDLPGFAKNDGGKICRPSKSIVLTFLANCKSVVWVGFGSKWSFRGNGIGNW